MTESRDHNLAQIIPQFDIPGRLLECYPCTSGHINDTYISVFEVNGRVQRYVHQWINHFVFKRPELVMENIARVTEFCRQKIVEAGGDPQRETLTLIPCRDGCSYLCSTNGDYWRTYLFIEGAHTYDQMTDLRQVYNASHAFGNFQKILSQLPGEPLHETIPDFHNTHKRFGAFLQAIEEDRVKRAKQVKKEIDFILQREADTRRVVDLLEQGVIPQRVTHNDTKLNNVMIDDQTGKGICVIDLDTVMPGSALYDFGDSVRMGASTAAEDERDLDKVGLDLEMFASLAHGYLDATNGFLTVPEIEHLAFSAKLITLEQAMRFLTDYLNGDVYYKIHRPDHNLDRCRTQMKMVQEIEQKMNVLDEIIQKHVNSSAES